MGFLVKAFLEGLLSEVNLGPTGPEAGVRVLEPDREAPGPEVQSAPTSGEPIREDRLAVGPSAEPTCPIPTPAPTETPAVPCPAPSPGGLPLAASVEAQSPPTGEGQHEPAPAAPTPGVGFLSVWLSIPITSRIYAFDRRDRLCYGPDCYLWTFEQSPVWYYQAETPLPPLRRQGEHYYVDTKAVMELAQKAPGTRLPAIEQAQNRP